jgi:hypothetical protein
MVSDANGQEIESGQSEEISAHGKRWMCMTTSAVPQGATMHIAVTADQPGAQAGPRQRNLSNFKIKSQPRNQRAGLLF